MAWFGKAKDGLKSLVTGMGDANFDKAATTCYDDNHLSYQELHNIYRNSWLGRKIIDVPAYDALRKWRIWNGEANHIEAIEKLEKRLNLQQKVLKCKKLARLWGGAAIFIGTRDENLEMPLDLKRLGKDGIQYLTVLSRNELTAGEIDQNVFSHTYGKPKYYTVATIGDQSGAHLHPSRFVLMNGADLPDDWAMGAYNDGWGDSVIQATYDVMKNADSTGNNIASLVFEANVDVFGIPKFMSLLGDKDKEKSLLERFSLARMGKGIHKTLVHDAAETYERKQISFQTLPDVLQAMLLLVSGASRIPMTKLIGQSAKGMSATGEGDMKNYYDDIQSMQKLEIGQDMHNLDEALIISALGNRPDDIYYEWSPLEQMNEKEIAEIGKSTADTVVALHQTGLFTPEELRDASASQFIETGVFPSLETAMAETEKGGGFDFDFDTPEQVTDAEPAPLYISRKVLNPESILDWARSQGFTNLRDADDLHVTVMYSKRAVNWMLMGQDWNEILRIPQGGARLVDEFEKGVMVLSFGCDDLVYRHRDLKGKGATYDYENYQPHITFADNAEGVDISQIEPYQGEILLGAEVFEKIQNPEKEIF